MMLKILVLLTVGLLLSACQTNSIQPANNSGANDGNVELTIEEACAKYKCRENFRLYFKTENQVVDETVPLFWPRVFDNSISIMPGESFFVEADLIDNKLVNLKEVTEVIYTDKTISLSFTQRESSLGMTLLLKNPFENVALKFNMDMIDFEGNPHRTSSCPALPKAAIYESWPHVIPELIISNPVVMSQDKLTTFRCEY